MKQSIEKIIKIRLIISLYIGLSSALIIPSLIKLQGSLFKSSELALILIIPSIIKMFQWSVEKLSNKQALYLPLMMDIIYPFTLIILFSNIKMFVIVEIVLSSIFMLAYYGRSVRISELIKDQYNISKFSNQQMTMISIGTVLGYITSMILTRYIDANIILSISIILDTWLIMPTIIVNKLVLKVVKLSLIK